LVVQATAKARDCLPKRGVKLGTSKQCSKKTMINRFGTSFVLWALMLAALTGCSSESTPTIKIAGARTANISMIAGVRTANISMNGKHVQVRDRNVTYNGQKITIPENSMLKIAYKNKSVCIYADEKLVYEE